MKGCRVPIPTKDEFDSWLSLASIPVETAARLPAVLTIDGVAEYLREADEDNQRAFDKLREMVAFQWLVEQREYKRAYDRVFGVRHRTAVAARQADPDRFRKRAEQILDSFERSQPSGSVQAEIYRLSDESMRRRIDRQNDERLRERIQYRAAADWTSLWVYGTMGAVAEYLEGKTASRFQDAVKELAAAAQAAQVASAKYVELAEEVNRANLRNVGIVLGRFKSRLAPRFDVHESPIGRKDARIDERLFVYRMFFLNRGRARSPKVEAIAELMGLEGFRHQYDSRTIERLCARFAEQDRESRSRRAAGTGSKG